MSIAVTQGDKALHCLLVSLNAGLYIENPLHHRHRCIVGDPATDVEVSQTNASVGMISLTRLRSAEGDHFEDLHFS
jgi:hypothetical protein